MKVVSLMFAVLMVVMAVSPAVFAGSGHVDIDISSITTPFEMEVQLYSMSEPYDDSWAWLDNVVSGAEILDFEDGTLQGFDDSWNPGSVVVAPGTINGSGAQVLEIGEDPLYLSTITFRGFMTPTTSTLSFDFSTDLHGSDSLVVSILDSSTGSPLLGGLSDGYGDVLAISAEGAQFTGNVSVTTSVIPVPGALGLGLVGVGILRMFRDRRGSRSN